MPVESITWHLFGRRNHSRPKDDIMAICRKIALKWPKLPIALFFMAWYNENVKKHLMLDMEVSDENYRNDAE